MENPVLVRCPVCGNQLRVAMAVGQLLRCVKCQTHFNAPLAESAPPADSPVTNEPDANEKIENSVFSLDLQASGEPPSATQPLPPTRHSHSHSHSTTAADADDAAASQDLAAEEFPDQPGSRWSDYVFYLVCLLAAGVAVAVMYWLAFKQPWRQWLVDQDQQPAEVASGDEPDPDSFRWTDASKFSQRGDRVTVRVTRVEFGLVVGKDANNQVISSEDARFLKLFLNVRNQGADSRQYTSWYGNTFQRNGKTQLATLFDDQQREYQMMTFADVARVQGHTKETTLAALQDTDDLIVFSIPEDVDRGSIQYFRLTLPAAAVGGPGDYRFQIPRSMVEQF